MNLPFRINPLVPFEIPNIYKRLQRQFISAFKEFNERNGGVQVQMKLGCIKTRQSNDVMLDTIRRLSGDSPIVVNKQVLRYQFDSSVDQQRFTKMNEYLKKVVNFRDSKQAPQFFRRLCNGSQEMVNIVSAGRSLKMDVKAKRGENRFEFDWKGSCKVTKKSKLRQHLQIIWKQVDLRLSTNLQQNVQFDINQLKKCLEGEFTCRVKHTNKYVKNGWIQFALSQVLQLQLTHDKSHKQIRDTVIQAINNNQELQRLLPALMANFYQIDCKYLKKFQVQAQLLPKAFHDFSFKGRAKDEVYALAKNLYEDMVAFYGAKEFMQKEYAYIVSEKQDKCIGNRIGEYVKTCIDQPEQQET